MHTFRVHGVDQELRLVRFDGHEGISELFAFDITLACDDRDLPFDSIVGQPALLEIRSGEVTRHVHGIVSDFEQGDEGKKLTAYRATLVPAVWRLRHRRASRIFQGDTTKQIIEKILLKANIPGNGFRFALRAEYKPREYCVQYRESDWAFVCRLMEEDGIAYHFEHTEGGHVLVMADNPSAHPPIEGDAKISFRPPSGALHHGEHVSRIRWAERVRPGKVTLRDYNFKKPTLSLERVADARGDLEVYDYPGDYDEPGEGARLAEVRLDELRATRRTGGGESNCARILPGFTFTLTEHHRDDLNRSYLVTRVEHHGVDPHLEAAAAAEQVYENRFEIIPGDAPFRPPQITPKPTIRGVQTAFVVGPGGEEIYTDEHGRIKVKFHWDREGKGDETSSCWIRVSQIWAGSAWGAVFLPRIGHEVVVDFIEGDPDRPLVVGSVYHGANIPPYPLPAERTKSTIKSNSSTGGGGFNEIRLEDKKGSEEIFLHAQKDWNILVEHDKSQEIGHDEELVVKHDRDVTVGNDETETIGGNLTIAVAKTLTETVGEDVSLGISGGCTVTVDKDHSETVRKSQSVDVGESQTISVGKSKSESVGESSSETVGKNKSVDVDENYTLSVTKDGTVKIGKNAKEEVGEKKMVIVGKELAVQVGDATITVKKNGDITVQGKKISVKGTGPIEVEGKKLQVKSDGDVSVEASGKVKVKGSNVGVN